MIQSSYIKKKVEAENENEAQVCRRLGAGAFVSASDGQNTGGEGLKC